MPTPPPDDQGPGQPRAAEVAAPDAVSCYRHPGTPTKLRCSRCDRPICGACATPASVGQHCPECVDVARRTTRSAKSTMAASAPAVVAIVAIDVIVYLVQLTAGDAFTERFGASTIHIAAGEWWRLVTPMFLHSPGSILHILFNMFVLWLYGPMLEQALGTARFVVLYLVAGFAATATSYAFGSCFALGVGASGAIFGVVGALIVYAYNRRRSSFVNQYLRNLLFLVGLNMVIGFVVPGIDVWAHGGGLVAGLALGAGVDAGENRRASAARNAVAFALVAGAGLALVMWRTATLSCGPVGVPGL